MQIKNWTSLLKVLILALTLTACAASSGEVVPAVKIETLRGPPPPGIQVVEQLVDRKQYRKIIQTEGDLNLVRMVEVYSRNKQGNSPQEFRLLDVRQGSAFDLVGLQNADVIVATDGYVIPSQIKFWAYMVLIQDFEIASIELRRNGRPMLLKIKMKGPVEED